MKSLLNQTPLHIVSGLPGYGKTFAIKRTLIGSAKDAQIVVIDPYGEYKNIRNNGETHVIDISRSSLNPLDLIVGENIMENILQILDKRDFLSALFAQASGREENFKMYADILELALPVLYSDYTTACMLQQKKYLPDICPTLKDLKTLLESEKFQGEKMDEQSMNCIKETVGAIHVLSEISVFTEKTRIFQSDCMIFNLQNIPQTITHTVYLACAEYAQNIALRGLTEKKKILVADDGLVLLHSKYLKTHVDNNKKNDIEAFVIIQEIADVIKEILRADPECLEFDVFHPSHLDLDVYEHISTTRDIQDLKMGQYAIINHKNMKYA